MTWIFISVLFILTEVADASILSIASRDILPDILHVFPEIKEDLSLVTWGHAINSQQLLKQVINKSSAVMMLEADVSKGHLIGNSESSEYIPVMAHPPDNVSDISLEMWIQAVVRTNQAGIKKGAKLDFKDLDIVLPSLKILKTYSSLITFPLWLNADILPGPGGANEKPVDADSFLNLCQSLFPDATLSLGWTTGVKAEKNEKYTIEMVKNMRETIQRHKINQPITFPIRAAFVGKSMEVLWLLFKSHPKESFTIWTFPPDEVNLKALASFQYLIGKKAVYFDMSADQVKETQEFRARNDALMKVFITQKTTDSYSLVFVATFASWVFITVIFAFYYVCSKVRTCHYSKNNALNRYAFVEC